MSVEEGGVSLTGGTIEVGFISSAALGERGEGDLISRQGEGGGRPAGPEPSRREKEVTRPYRESKQSGEGGPPWKKKGPGQPILKGGKGY